MNKFVSVKSKRACLEWSRKEKVMNKVFYGVLWLLGIIALASRAEFVFHRAEWADSTTLPIVAAPLIEETLKFVAMRATGLALFIGIGFQIAEALGKGELRALVLSPHWLFALPYAVFGVKWKWLPFAIVAHALWNAYIQFDAPMDEVLVVPLILFFAWGLWLLRKENAKCFGLG